MDTVDSVFEPKLKISSSRSTNRSTFATISIHHQSKHSPSEPPSCSSSFRIYNTPTTTYNTAHGQSLKMINNNNVYEIYGQKPAPLATSASSTVSSGIAKSISRLGFIFQQHQIIMDNQNGNENSPENINGNFLEENLNHINRDEVRAAALAAVNSSTNSAAAIGAIRITENPLPETVVC